MAAYPSYPTSHVFHNTSGDNINGFIMPSLDAEGLKSCIELLISMNGDDLKQMALKAHEMGQKFTYDFYNLRITRDILSSAK